MEKSLSGEMAEFARKIRIDTAKILNRTNDSHIGGGYSSIDILSLIHI